MLKNKNCRRVSMGLILVFLFAILLPAGAALAAGCEITAVPKSGIKPKSTPQDLGYVKISEIETCDAVYLEITLPDGVEWDTPIDDSTVEDYIYIRDKDGQKINNGAILDADETGYTVVFDDPAMFADKAYIRADFKNIIVHNSAPDDICIDIAVTAVEDGMTIWRVKGTSDQASYGIKVACEKVAAVYSGDEQSFGTITLSENAPGSFQTGDRLTLTLPEGCEWQEVGAKASQTGLSVRTELKGKQLNLTITRGDASTSKNALVLNGSIKVALAVPAGNISINIQGDLDRAEYKSTELTIAKKTLLVSKLSIGSQVQFINGKSVMMDAAPYIKNDRTYLPVRFVCYGLGMNEENILWDPVERTVTIHQGDITVQLTVGSETGKINGVNQQLDTAPEITGDRTMLPVRFIAEAFGASVTWDPVSQSVEITR